MAGADLGQPQVRLQDRSRRHRPRAPHEERERWLDHQQADQARHQAVSRPPVAVEGGHPAEGRRLPQEGHRRSGVSGLRHLPALPPVRSLAQYRLCVGHYRARRPLRPQREERDGGLRNRTVGTGRGSGSGSPRPATSTRTTRRSTARSRASRSARSRSPPTPTTPSPPPSASSARSSSRSRNPRVAKGAGATVSLESYGATVLRIALGIIFVMHAFSPSSRSALAPPSPCSAPLAFPFPRSAPGTSSSPTGSGGSS